MMEDNTMKASDENKAVLDVKEQTDDDNDGDVVCIGTPRSGVVSENLDGSLFQDGPLLLPQRLPFTSTQISNSESKSDMDLSVKEQNFTVMSAKKLKLLQNDRNNAYLPPSKRNRSLIPMAEAFDVLKARDQDVSRTDACGCDEGSETPQNVCTENNMEVNDAPTFVTSSSTVDSFKSDAVTTTNSNIRSDSPLLFDSDDDFFNAVSSSDRTQTDDPNSSVTVSSVEQQRKVSHGLRGSEKCSRTKSVSDKENSGTVYVFAVSSVV